MGTPTRTNARRRVYSSACSGTLEKTWVPGLRPGLQMQTRLPSRPTGTMPKNYHNHSVNVNKVLHVTMSCAVSMYAMLAAYGHQPVRDFDLLVSSNRPETARRRSDQTQYLMIMKHD